MYRLKFVKMSPLFVALLTSFGLGQQLNPNESNLRYPNELNGFKLIQNSRLKNLIPGITTATELNEVFNSYRNDTRNPLCDQCLIIGDWEVDFTQLDSREGNLFTIEFHPRKRIPFSKIRFSKQFEKHKMGISDNDISECIVYEDKFGLSYVIVNDEGNEKYKKGDLYYIEYGAPADKSKKYL
jgi:hypothetical protein